MHWPLCKYGWACNSKRHRNIVCSQSREHGGQHKAAASRGDRGDTCACNCGAVAGLAAVPWMTAVTSRKAACLRRR